MGKRDEDSLIRKGTAGTIVPRDAEAERTAFINKPVRLTPAWEARNLPNDELNFRHMTMDRVTMELNPPLDKYKLIFFTLLLHGIGTLMPWNMFINAKSYYEGYKLNGNITGNPNDTIDYSQNFMPYVTFFSQVPNVFFNWVNIFVNLGGTNLTPRIFWSLIVQVLVFIFTVVLAMVDSREWTQIFFWTTMGSVVVLNTACGIYQNSVYGMSAKLPFKYTGAVVLGSNISGTFTTSIEILSFMFSSSARTAAIYYFIGAMFIILMCFDTYFALPLNRFYRYNELQHEKEMEKTRQLGGTSTSERPPYWKIFKQAFPQLFNVFFTFFVTLSLFPTVQSEIYISDAKNFIVPRAFYRRILCFLTFNVSAMLGSLTTSWIKWPRKERLIWPVLLRALFIPLFVFCNYRPKGIQRLLPVYITNDWSYWTIGSLMGFSSGYLSSLGMMYAPQTVASKHASTAGMFSAAMLISGIFAGILTSSVHSRLIQSVKIADYTLYIEQRLFST